MKVLGFIMRIGIKMRLITVFTILYSVKTVLLFTRIKLLVSCCLNMFYENFDNTLIYRMSFASNVYLRLACYCS
jgi:hypothetical protein